MKHRLRVGIVACAMFCVSYGLVCAAPIELTYDGVKHAYNLEPITLYINGQETLTTVMPPIQLEGYVVVPAREVFGTMGAKVDWKGQEKKVYVDDGKSLIVLEIDSKEAWVNGEVKSLDMPAKLINNKVMIPIRFISEALGFKVEWLGNERNIYIDKPISEDLVESLPTDEIETEEEIKEEPEVSIPDTSLDLEAIFPYVSYDSVTNTLLLENPSGLLASQILVTDLYRERKIILDLQGDYSNLFNNGLWQGELGKLSGLSISNGITTQITIDTAVISAINLYEQAGKIAVQFIKPSEKYDKIIVLDPGHGGTDGGTSAAGFIEKNLTLAYGRELYSLLENDGGIKVYTTREQDIYPTLQERVDWANEIEPDIYISIHINSFTNTAVKGAETFYYKDPNDLRGQIFATNVQKALVETFNMADRKAKAYDYFVIRNTNVPAILIEAGFISNEEDRAKLTAADYPKQYAELIYTCILQYYEQGLYLQ